MGVLTELSTQPRQIISLSEIIFLALSLIGIALTSLYAYTLYHSIVELFGIVISLGIFVVGWNSRKYSESTFFLTLGIAFGFIAIIDTLHLFTYKGMGIFPYYDSNLPTSLWIAARSLQTFALLFAITTLKREFNVNHLGWGFFIITLALIFSIFFKIFPVCYIDNSGLTPFKIISEYIIDGALFVALLLIYRNRAEFDHNVFLLIGVSILANIVSEISFTLYVDVYGIFNLVGHLSKVVAVYFLYKSIIQTALEHPYDLLFRKLKQSEQDLAQKNQDLQRSNKDLEMFAYTASHDMQEPLRKVVRFLSLLGEQSKDQLDAEAKEFIGIAMDGATRMKQMISDMLEYARVGTQGAPFESTDLETLLKEVLADLQIQLEDTKGEVTHDPLPALLVDAKQLKQVFYNLINNALKFHGKDPPRIHISAKQGHNEWVIFIKDNGIGIDMNQARRLFQLFQRLEARDTYPGTGLGLAKCRRIIERHGGKIWLESELGRGSTFYFSIPSLPSNKNINSK